MSHSGERATPRPVKLPAPTAPGSATESIPMGRSAAREPRATAPIAAEIKPPTRFRSRAPQTAIYHHSADISGVGSSPLAGRPGGSWLPGANRRSNRRAPGGSSGGDAPLCAVDYRVVAIPPTPYPPIMWSNLAQSPAKSTNAAHERSSLAPHEVSSSPSGPS